MPNESTFEITTRLYEKLLAKVSSVPNVRVRKHHIFDSSFRMTFNETFRRADNSVSERSSRSSYSVDYLSLAEIVVDYERRCKFELLGHRFGDKPLASLDDVRTALAQVPEIGEPLYHDDNFLFYETIGNVISGWPNFDLTVIGNSRWLLGDCNGETKIRYVEIGDGKTNEGFIHAHKTKYGRDYLSHQHLIVDKRIPLTAKVADNVRTNVGCDASKGVGNSIYDSI